jgi:hypothetical protein
MSRANLPCHHPKPPCHENCGSRNMNGIDLGANCCLRVASSALRYGGTAFSVVVCRSDTWVQKQNIDRRPTQIPEEGLRQKPQLQVFIPWSTECVVTICTRPGSRVHPLSTPGRQQRRAIRVQKIRRRTASPSCPFRKQIHGQLWRWIIRQGQTVASKKSAGMTVRTQVRGSRVPDIGCDVCARVAASALGKLSLSHNLDLWPRTT